MTLFQRYASNFPEKKCITLAKNDIPPQNHLWHPNETPVRADGILKKSLLHAEFKSFFRIDLSQRALTRRMQQWTPHPLTFTAIPARCSGQWPGQMTIFTRGMSSYFFMGYDRSMEEFFQRKKSGSHPSKNVYLTHKTSPKRDIISPDRALR